MNISNTFPTWAGRTASLHRPYVRPFKPGKQGRATEFGARGALTHVDGFLFLDYWKHEAFNESEYVARHVVAYAERFRKLPPFSMLSRNMAGVGKNDPRQPAKKFAGRQGIYGLPFSRAPL